MNFLFERLQEFYFLPLFSMLRWHILCWQLLWKSILLKLVDLRCCKTTTKTIITTTTNDFVVRTQEEEILSFIMYVRFQRLHEQALKAGKEKRACNFVSGIWISASKRIDSKCWLADMKLVMTSLPLARVSQFLFTFTLVFASRWLAKIWKLSRRGATEVLEMVFKFQKRSCKLSFLFPPHRQIAAESLLAG